MGTGWKPHKIQLQSIGKVEHITLPTLESGIYNVADSRAGCGNVREEGNAYVFVLFTCGLIRRHRGF